MKLFKKYTLIAAVAFVLLMQSCQQPGGDTTGSEFMPDMAHSVAYEANYYNYYYNNTWGTEEEYYEFAKPKLPVKGTVPRQSSSSISIPKASGSQPYYYEDTEEERTRAMNEIIDNPYPITDEGLNRGKELYNTFCAICHGEKGDGNGYLARDDGAYPVAPAQLINEEFTAASNGRYYHSIMYGKNVMGAYKDKISYEERWQVIHYIRSLQAKANSTVYNQLENTLNNVDRPAGPDYMVVVEEEDHDHMNGDHDHNDVDEHGHHEHDDHDSKEHDHDGGSHDHDGNDHDHGK
ncbi:MAG: c-type cytochrome [Saprospiraceae bacterium]|nr:cytochrome c [Bacteroidia bacterium]NNE13876.1 c-type cytochrome [Saprospiraceae bacterium]NNL92409.1 c-type cytochrome [Saprospiraceae bacterium]